MKIIFLCGYFAKENEQEVNENAKIAVEYSANIFQDKLIEGLEDNNYDFEVISAPFIGAFPNGYKKSFFRGFKERQTKCKYVKFNNIWGIRNFSRANSLKHTLKDFIEYKDEKKLIIVYSVHTPLLSAAVYAKRKDSNIKICLIVPDLPQYMNLSAKKSALYKIGKKFDIRKFNKLNKFVDSYVLLTEAMKEKLDIHNKPYIVAEGIVSKKQLDEMADRTNLPQKEEGCKYIVYTGKMYKKFGVKDLLDTFENIEDGSLRLVLCGTGDLNKYINELSEKDKRVIYKGQVSPNEALKWVKAADVLVNPRKDDSEYTKYSFPSKNIEFLLSGNPVIAYQLKGMKECYKDYIVQISNGNLKTAIMNAFYEENTREKKDFFKYVIENLYNSSILQNIVKVSF